MTRFTGAMLLDAERLPSLDGLDVRLSTFEALAATHMSEAFDGAYDQDFWPRQGSWMSGYRPYVVKDGVLQVPIKGMLLNGFPYAFGEWATGYEYIRAAIERGLEDPQVQSFAFHVNSGGGMVTGCFDAADDVYRARSLKGSVAWVNDHAYSAAYALACAANTIMVSRTGGVGSIGVVTYHMDVSALYESAGVKKTYIFKGKHKVDGNEAEALPSDVKARIEERLEVAYTEFVRTVARNRGLSEKAVRDTEALTYTPSAAVEVGLADKIGAYGDVFLADVAETSDDGDDEMAETKAEKIYSQADLDSAVAAHTEAAVAAHAEGLAAGAAAERTRIDTILGSEEAKTRPVAARQVAFKTAMSTDDAKVFLGGFATEQKATARGTLDAKFAAEQATDRPALAADGNPAGDDAANPDGKLVKDRAYYDALAKRA